MFLRRILTIRPVHWRVPSWTNSIIQPVSFIRSIHISTPKKVLSLQTIQKPKEKKARRVGRGGKGRTAGRGRKGWKAKHGKARPLPGFEGGQSGIIKSIPKIGIQQKSLVQQIQRNLRPVPLDKLQLWIDLGRLDASKPITIKDICLSGVAGKVKEGVVLLAKVSLLNLILF